MEWINLNFFVYCVLGVFSGFVAGLLGLGGGIVIVPALYFLFSWQGIISQDLTMHLAVATSLSTIIFTSIASCYTHNKYQAVDWTAVFTMIPGIIIGSIVGAFIADSVSSNLLRTFFGVFEILVAVQIWFGFQPIAQKNLPENKGLVLVGICIGLISTMLGIGGGTLIVPFLLWCSVDMRQAVGTSSACGLPIAIVGALSFIIVGWENPVLPKYAQGYVFLPAAVGIILTSMITAPLGARLAHKIPRKQLKKLFAATLLLVGIRILI